MPGSRDLTVVDGFALCALGLLPIALLPGFLFPTHFRVAIAFAGVPLGAFLLARAAVVERRLAAFFGLAFVGVSVFSALGTAQWPVSLRGSVNYELSALALLAAFGWWAIGRELSQSARQLLPLILTVGAGVNLAIGLLQVVVDPRVGIYRSFEGRPHGLMSNPVFLASFVVGLWAFWFVRSTRRTNGSATLLPATLAFGLGLSGGRSTALIVVVGVCVALAARPARARAILISGAASAAGLAIGGMVLGLAATDQAERLGRPSQGISVRVEVWKTALSAWLERPLIGWGPNPYLHESNTRLPEATVREFGRLQWPDPHNVVVLVLVTAGVVGMVALIAFVWTGLRGRVDYALLGLAGAIVASWMLQPVIVSGWPIAFAAFGAAVRTPVVVDDALQTESGRRLRTATRALVLVGVVVAGGFMIWSLQFRAALRDPDPAVVEARASVMKHDPEVLERVVRSYVRSGATGDELQQDLERGSVLAGRAVDLGSNPEHWELLVEAKVHQEDWEGAFAAAGAWTEDWPNDPAAFQLLGWTAEIIGDDDAAAAARAKFCRLVDCEAASSPDG